MSPSIIKKRITISLNPAKIIDTQILAALDHFGGEMSDILKMLAYRGVIADPVLVGIITQGTAIVGAAHQAPKADTVKPPFRKPKQKTPAAPSQVEIETKETHPAVSVILPASEALVQTQTEVTDFLSAAGTELTERQIALRVMGDFG